MQRCSYFLVSPSRKKKTSTKTGKITLFCGSRLFFPSARQFETSFLRQFETLFLRSLPPRGGFSFLFVPARGAVLRRDVFVASDFKVGAGAGCDVLHEFHGDGFVGGVCAVGFDILQTVEG